MKFFVEITVATEGAFITKHEPAKDWTHSVTLAQELATKMFPEDPMSSRVFRSGRYEYTSVNDFGEPVLIRPVVSSVNLREEPPRRNFGVLKARTEV